MSTIRKIRPWLSIWPAICVVVLGLFLAAMGAYFALRESRVAINIRVDALRPRARSLADTIQKQFVDATTDALRDADKAFQNSESWAFESIQAQFPWCTIFMAFDQGRFTTWPKPPIQIQPLPLALAPQSFLLADQFEFAKEDLDEAIRLYKLCISSATSIPWQRRAKMAIAGCRLKQDKPADALQIYNQLLADVSSLPVAGYAPTPLDIHLVRIDALEALNRNAEARRAILDLANRLAAGNISAQSRDQAEYVFDRLNALAPKPQSITAPLRAKLQLLMDKQAVEKRLDRLARSWLQAQLPLPPRLPNTPAALQFLFNTTDKSPYGLVLLDVSQDPAEPRAVLAALSPGAVEARLRSILTRQEDGEDLTIRYASDPTIAPGLWAVPISPHFIPWEIEPAPEFLQLARIQAYRRTVTSLGFTILLVAALFIAVYMMVSAIRRQMALAQLKSDFVANVSHELKTPLALIRLFGETLLAGRVRSQEKAQEYFQIITRESERLTHLINNILDFSRIEVGQKQYRKSPSDIGQLVRNTLAAYQHELDHRSFQHRLHVESDLPPVLLDSEAFQQALINLIDNAVKYSPEEKWLEVSVKRIPENDRENVCVTISDHGTGLGAADRKKLFDPFYRAPAESAAAVRGTGLGLALVKHIVDAHGGKIEVLSQPGKGTTFRIIFPAADSGYPGSP